MPLVMMLVLAPVMKGQLLIRRWTATHIPLMVGKAQYTAVLDDVEQVLRMSGRECRREPASWMLRLPSRLLELLAGGPLQDLVAARLTTLVGRDFSVLLHPSDLLVRGKEREVMRIHALLTENLMFTEAYRTWSRDGQAIEDRLIDLWRMVQRPDLDFESEDALARLGPIAREMESSELSRDEWEVLYLQRLTIERRLLRDLAGLADRHRDFSDPHRPRQGGADAEPAALGTTGGVGTRAHPARCDCP